MRAAIIFYSFSGNTRKAGVFLSCKLNEINIGTDIIDLKPRHEEKGFFKQCYQAFSKKKPELFEADCSLDKYDVIVFASPVWAFTFAPALRTYLDKITSMKEKKTACFLTYGSGTGSGKALKELEEILRQKGAHILFSRNLSGAKIKDEEFLNEQFKSLLETLTSV